jgi:hypothetical protein
VQAAQLAVAARNIPEVRCIADRCHVKQRCITLTTENPTTEWFVLRQMSGVQYPLS